MKVLICILSLFICLVPDGVYTQNAPITTAGTFRTINSTATISITAINFTNIASYNLELHYDSTIARATSVSAGPLMGSSLSSNISIPGKIMLGWYSYPALTLDGDPVLFTIGFTKIDTGTTALTWYDNGYTCIYYDGNSHQLNDVPTSAFYISGALTFLAPVAPVIIAPVIHGTTDGNINIPVHVNAFNDVGKFTLNLHYDASVLTYQSFTGNDSYTDLTVDGNTPGTIYVLGLLSTGVSGIFLPDSATLFTLQFKPSIGTSPLTWLDNGTSCLFFGPPPNFILLSNVPLNKHYIDGSVTITAPYGIPIPGGDASRNDDEHSLKLKSSPNPFAGDMKLTWFLPVKGQALLEIRNLPGKKIITLVDELEQQGNHTLQLSSLDIDPGIYIVTITLTTNNTIMTKSIKIIKKSCSE